jgi:uncharacterized repeat protein (TIGR03847 family)
MDLGLVADLIAESFGEPGQRTFRLLVRTPEGIVSLWLEKEQIVALGAALEELLERVRGGDAPIAPRGPLFVGELEVRVGSLTLGFSSEQQGFVMEAGDFISPFDFETIRLTASRGQLERAEEQIGQIVAGGRPRCPLCGTPLTGEPHFCPPSNGHAHLSEEE